MKHSLSHKGKTETCNLCYLIFLLSKLVFLCLQDQFYLTSFVYHLTFSLGSCLKKKKKSQDKVVIPGKMSHMCWHGMPLESDPIQHGPFMYLSVSENKHNFRARATDLMLKARLIFSTKYELFYNSSKILAASNSPRSPKLPQVSWIISEDQSHSQAPSSTAEM